MPKQFQQQTLRYEDHTDEIAELAIAIDHLGRREVEAALEILMALRNRWQDAQKPRVVDYDPQAEQRRA